jgi:small subunit ribosomal protein S11
MVKNLKRRSRNKSIKKTPPSGLVSVKATFTNTIISVGDREGNVLFSCSGGRMFKDARKKTPFAGQSAAKQVALEAYAQGMREVDLVLRGAGRGRKSVMRTFARCGFRLKLLRDLSAIPHNGCRPPKRRRV